MLHISSTHVVYNMCNMWYINNMEINQRVVVYVPQEDYRKLKSLLVAEGKTVSGWFREKAEEELKTLSDVPSSGEKAQKFEELKASLDAPRCPVYGCKGVADTPGKQWDEVEGWVDKMMCEKHANSSLKEAS